MIFNVRYLKVINIQALVLNKCQQTKARHNVKQYAWALCAPKQLVVWEKKFSLSELGHIRFHIIIACCNSPPKK